MANFIVGANYQVLEVIGEGAYGIVWYVCHMPFFVVHAMHFACVYYFLFMSELFIESLSYLSLNQLGSS